MASGSLLISFLGALQASLAVLLTIFYGVIAAQFNLLDGASAKSISKVCVRMFLPALLITKVGSELHADTAIRYLPIVIWSLIYTLSSMLFGIAATRIFKFPAWVTPAICFNNTTSLPLLLIQSLATTGILEKLVISKRETSSEAVQRAISYFLVCSTVGNCLTFAIGPRLLDSEHGPDEAKENRNGDEQHENGDVEQGQGQGQQEEDQDENIDEQTSLLPNAVRRGQQAAERDGYHKGKKYWDKLSPQSQEALDFLFAFFNAPLIGAVIGAFIGFVPGLHRAFFNSSENGGFFNAWLTSSVKNIGDLFASLQVVVVGVCLSTSLRKLKRGESSGKVAWVPSLFVLVVRFLVWPIVSISVIWAIATRTRWLSDDPMLWFALMLMPTGPSAMKLVAMADVNGAEEQEKLSISKFLTISYVISPLICFAVVGSLKASEAAMGNSIIA